MCVCVRAVCVGESIRGSGHLCAPELCPLIHVLLIGSRSCFPTLNITRFCLNMCRRSMPRHQEDSSSRQCQCYRACRCLQRIKNACESTHSTNTSVSVQQWGETAHSAQQGQVGRRAAGSSGQGSRVRLYTHTCPSVSRRRRQAWSAPGACGRESARRARTSCLCIKYIPRAAPLSPTNFPKAGHLITSAHTKTSSASYINSSPPSTQSVRHYPRA